ncbi:hypothetical protein MRB53_027291 [Persea americana]|uniref:Uncharacterized protein n=2 Tax=Persea americana TaxID=3435 RepID=A0ACC2LKK7_PERAE|nr:hypothetical protein MRB53_027288 [Persea americana]KAJ8633955.1 hypothetical protein MRB53_027291 [Persea americana]
MESAVTSGLVRVVLSNLNKLLTKEVVIEWGLTRKPKNLHNTLNGMQSVIEDAQEKKVQSLVLRGWLIRMKEVAYEADDVLDEFAMKILQTIGKIGSNNKGFPQSFGEFSLQTHRGHHLLYTGKRRIHLLPCTNPSSSARHPEYPKTLFLNEEDEQTSEFECEEEELEPDPEDEDSVVSPKLQVHRQSHVPDLGPDMLDVARKILVEPKDIVPNIKEVEEDERLKLMLDLMRRPGGWVHAEKDKLAALVKKMNTAAKSRSVMELCDAGVEFRAADDEVVTLSSIKFENGVLTLPIIRPSYKFEVLGCNMVAFEDIHGGNLHNAAFCFSFMKGLLTSVEDARHLRSLKIIQSVDLSDEGILQTFRRILRGKILMLNLFSKLNRVQDQLEEFYLNRTTGCGDRLWKWITSLKQKYFNNPWTFIAIVSAALLLALAMTQTYYTALPYWDGNHKNN